MTTEEKDLLEEVSEKDEFFQRLIDCAAKKMDVEDVKIYSDVLRDHWESFYKNYQEDNKGWDNFEEYLENYGLSRQQFESFSKESEDILEVFLDTLHEERPNPFEGTDEEAIAKALKELEEWEDTKSLFSGADLLSGELEEEDPLEGIDTEAVNKALKELDEAGIDHIDVKVRLPR